MNVYIQYFYQSELIANDKSGVFTTQQLNYQQYCCLCIVVKYAEVIKLWFSEQTQFNVGICVEKKT